MPALRVGATGDVAWRDRDSGQLLSHDVDISASTLDAVALRLLAECGSLIRQTAAKLSMPDWPEGVRRAISFTFVAPHDLAPAPLAYAGATGDGLLASLRESLSNIARHAQATHVDVEIEVDADVVLRVCDDGIGPPGPGARRGKGLDNLAARAARLGGALTLHPGDKGGTVLEWRVPKR